MLILTPEQIMELARATSIKPKVRERIGNEQSNAFAVLYGDTDTPASWVQAGQALSAVWLTAARLTMSVVPVLRGGPTTRQPGRDATPAGRPRYALPRPAPRSAGLALGNASTGAVYVGPWKSSRHSLC